MAKDTMSLISQARITLQSLAKASEWVNAKSARTGVSSSINNGVYTIDIGSRVSALIFGAGFNIGTTGNLKKTLIMKRIIFMLQKRQ